MSKPFHYRDLPEAARRAVEKQVGPVREALTATGESNPGIAALLVTEAGTLFLRATPADDPRAVEQGRALAVSPYLPASAPRVLWYIKAASWSLIGYEALDGVPADYSDSGDLVLVLDAVRELQAVDLPAGAGSVLAAEERWEPYADEGRAHLFAGSTLLHANTDPGNVLVGERAHFVDWTRATRGAAFIDPYLIALRMTAAGLRPADAITWVRRLSSWREAPTEALEAFAVAITRVWRQAAQEDPDPWRVTMAGRAAELRTYLLTTPWARNCG